MNKPRNKKHRPRNPNDALMKTQPWRMRSVFQPVIAILDQLENDGTMDISADGQPIFKDVIDGCYYDTCVALDGISECFELLSERKNIPIDTGPLRRISNKIRYHMPVFIEDTKACRACLDVLHSHCLHLRISEAVDLIQTIRVREELERIQTEKESA